MVLTPALLETFARDVVLAEHPNAACPMLAEAAAAHRQRLMQLTGNGVVPGTHAAPEMHVKRRVYIPKAQRGEHGQETPPQEAE